MLTVRTCLLNSPPVILRSDVSNIPAEEVWSLALMCDQAFKPMNGTDRHFKPKSNKNRNTKLLYVSDGALHDSFLS
jgi:hypothetical protein